MATDIITRTRTALLALCIMAGTAAKAQDYFHFYRDGQVAERVQATLVDSISFGTTGRSIMVYDKEKKRLYSARRNVIDSVVIKPFIDYTSYPALNLTSGYNNVEATYDNDTKVYSIHVTGGDPYILTETLKSDLPADSCVLTFEYNCPAGINEFQIFFCPPAAENLSAKVGSITPTVGTEWRTYSVPIKDYREDFSWGSRNDYLRFDFGTVPDVDISLRKISIRSFTPEEQREQAEKDSIKAAKERMAENIKAYLNATYASSVKQVNVTADEVTVTGECSGDGTFALADIAPYDDVTEETEYYLAASLPNGQFSVTLPRMADRSGFNSEHRRRKAHARLARPLCRRGHAAVRSRTGSA